MKACCWLQLEASKVDSSNLSGDIVEKFFCLKTVHFEGIYKIFFKYAFHVQ